MAASPMLTLAFLLSAFLLNVAEGNKDAFVVGEMKFEHKWQAKSHMPAKRSDMTATTVGDAIYLIGGCAMDQVWVKAADGWAAYSCGGGDANAVVSSTLVYFPKTDKFDSTLPDAPRPRYRHAAAALNGKIYLFGGVDIFDNIVPQIDVLDTATKKWDTLPTAMPFPTTDLAAFVYGGKIYTVGGYEVPSYVSVNTTQIFNPTGNKWSLGPELKRSRGDTFTAVVNGNAYVVGGFHHENNFNEPTPNLEGWDLTSSIPAWVDRAPMAVARGDKAVASLNNILHVVGGETKSSQDNYQNSIPLKDVEAYDPITNKWYFGGDIPSKRFRFTAATHGSSIFIFGGQGYLDGVYGTVGSKYPLMTTVEEYVENVSPVAIASKTSSKVMSIIITCMVCAMLMICTDEASI